MITTHNIFPTTIAEMNYTDSRQFNKLCKDTVMKCLDENGKTSVLVFDSFHHDDETKPFFRFVSSSMIEYLQRMGLDTTDMLVNITEAWFDVSFETAKSPHTHANYHYSFAYYVNNPEEIRRDIKFNMKYHPSEPHEGFFGDYRERITYEGAQAWVMPANVGTLYIFPSSLEHETVGHIDENPTKVSVENREDLENARICLAGDILITLKEDAKNNSAWKTAHPNNWRTFI